MERRRILLAISGGIAAYKAPELVRTLRRAGHEVRCAMTPEAARFVSSLALQAVSGEYRDYTCIEFAKLMAKEIGGFRAPEKYPEI